MVSFFFPFFLIKMKSCSVSFFPTSTRPPPPDPLKNSKKKNPGLGSSLLFVTYGAAQIPVAALGSRFGLVKTLGVACFCWGVVAMSMAAINSVGSFYAARLALGLAEAPTFPLIATILRSFHASDGAVAASYSYVHSSTLVASFVGAPLAAAILSMGKRWGLEAWRWLFIIEGLLPIALSVWIFTLPSSPANARFLTPQQRAALAQRVAEARGGGVGGGGGSGASSSGSSSVVASTSTPAGGGRGGAGSLTPSTSTPSSPSPSPLAPAPPRPPSLAAIRSALWATLLNWRLWSVAALEMVGSSGRFGVQFFTPLIIERLLERTREGGAAAERTAASVAASAALSAIPFGLAAVGAVVNAAVSKRVNHRKWFIVWPGIVCAAGLAVLGPLISKVKAEFVVFFCCSADWGKRGRESKKKAKKRKKNILKNFRSLFLKNLFSTPPPQKPTNQPIE